MPAAVEVTDLVKDYGSLRAVDSVSFAVDEGEVFALLGPNGAGKSTTVEILEGYRSRTGGAVRVLGVDPAGARRDWRDRIGIVLQSSGIDRVLTVRENLELYAACYRSPRPVDEVVELVELTEKADERVGSLSGGQQRRVDLALGLIGDPELLFLDEPTTGFDPAARRSSWSLIESLTSLGRTVVLTTHYMDEAEHLADRVAVISRGRIVAEGSPEQLRRASDVDPEVSFRLASPDLLEFLPERYRRHLSSRLGEVRFRTATPTADLHELTGWALGRGVELAGLQVADPTLEDVYLALVEADGS